MFADASAMLLAAHLRQFDGLLPLLRALSALGRLGIDQRLFQRRPQAIGAKQPPEQFVGHEGAEADGEGGAAGPG